MYYLSRVCCVCFESREKLNSLNNEVNQMLAQKFQYCIGDVEPDVPLFICNACCPSLNSAYEFKKSCAMNIARLRSCVSQLVQCKSSTNANVMDEYTVPRRETDRIVFSDFQVHIPKCSPTLNLSSKHLEPTFVDIQSIKTESELDPDLNNSVKVENDIDLSEGLSDIVKEEHSIMPIESVFLNDEVPCDEKSILNDSSDCVNMVEASNIHHTPTSSCLQSTEELGAKQSDKTCEVTKKKRQISMKRKGKSNTLFTCDICSKNFTEKIIWQAHVQCHNDPPYICTECGKEFTSILNFSRHVIVHLKKKGRISKKRKEIWDTPYTCDICNKQFSKKNYLQTHKQCHDNPPYICTECGKEFTSRVYFSKHAVVHSERIYKCTLCPKQFNRKPYLNNHFIRTHETECSKCNKVFKSNEEFQLHRTQEHLKELYFKCETCGKVLTRLKYYRNHMRSHEGGTPFQCKHCPQAFQNFEHLKAHIAVEHKIGKLQCKNCGKSFSDKSVFDKHVKTHYTESSHVCSQCGKKFKRIREFRAHVKNHDAEKNYSCSKCGKTYLYIVNLTNHMATHS